MNRKINSGIFFKHKHQQYFIIYFDNSSRQFVIVKNDIFSNFSFKTFSYIIF